MSNAYTLPRVWLGVLITVEIGAAIACLSALALAREALGMWPPLA